MTDRPTSADRDPWRFARLARKELRETLRDRRTILTLVLMPLFVYPLLGLTFQKFLLAQASQGSADDRVDFVIAFENEEAASWFLDLAARSATHLALDQRHESRGTEPPQWSAVLEQSGETDVDSLIVRGHADVGIRREEFGESADGISLIYDPELPRAREAKEALENIIGRLNADWYRQKLRRAGQSDSPRVDLVSEPVETVATVETTVATVIPFILLLMTATGAVYPAIDLTAGERERGTLEALVAAPVSRRAVLGAKYVAVFSVAVLTAGMNLVAMTATAFSLGLDQFLFQDGISAAAVAQVAGLVLVLASFFSALVLLVTSFARSFKEAQAYLIPLMMLSLAPGVVSLMPDLKLTLPLAVTPLVGIVLLARDILTERTTGLLILACVGSTVLYAAAALLMAARAFGTDAVLYGSGGTWRELFQRPASSRGTPPVTAAMATLAAIFPLFLLLGPLPARWHALGLTGQLWANGALTILMFLVIPSLATAACRADWRSTFALSRASMFGVLGAALLGVSLWPFAFELEMLVLSEVRVEALERLFAPIRARLNAVPIAVKLISLALIPAVCEEWFFRGFLLSSLRARLADVSAVLATGLLFGLFHVVVRDGLFLERMIPTAFLGLILGYVRIASGSLWPGMLLHAIHNAFIISLATFESDISAWGWSGGEQTHLPARWLLVAAVLVIAGEELLRFGQRRRGRNDSRAEDGR